MKEGLEYKMFGIVPYQLSEIQKGIQFAHALAQYSYLATTQNDNDFHRWINYFETIVLLNGGTTSKEENSLGSLNILSEELFKRNIKHTKFYEPTLGNQLTAICLLVDSRVWENNYSLNIEEMDIDTIDEMKKLLYLQRTLKTMKTA